MRQAVKACAILSDASDSVRDGSVMPEKTTSIQDGPDATLVARARDGSVSAFEILYGQNVGRTYAVCLRLTGDPALAEELTQDAFVRAWEKLHSFRGDSAFSSWLHRLTLNVVYAELRRRARHEAFLAKVPPSDGIVPGAPAARADLEQAIARLPDGARQAFVLHDVEGYRHEEIAEVAGIAVGTSKAQLHRARKLLREELTR